MLRKLTVLVAALAAMIGASLFTMARAEGGGNDYRVEARMRGTGTLASAKSTYRERMIGDTLEQRFKIQVEDFAPNTKLVVHINGKLFGTIVANDLGRGEFNFRTVIVDDTPGDDAPPIPEDFPRIEPGWTITVGPLSGSYVLR
jgi:hypothetical protein